MTEDAVLRFRVSVVAILKVVAVGVAFATCAIVLTVCYRLWVQTTSQQVASFPGDLIYAFGQILVAPFTGFDKTRPIRETAILDYAALLALEVYLVMGVAATAVTALASRFWPGRLRSLLVEIDLAPAQREVQAFGRALVAASRTTVTKASATDAWLRAHDWSRLQRAPGHAAKYVGVARLYASGRLALARPLLACYAERASDTQRRLLRSNAIERSRLLSNRGAALFARRWRILLAGRPAAEGENVSRREFLRRVLIHG